MFGSWLELRKIVRRRVVRHVYVIIERIDDGLGGRQSVSGTVFTRLWQVAGCKSDIFGISSI